MKAKILSLISSVLFFAFVLSFSAYAETEDTVPSKYYALYNVEYETFLTSEKIDSVIPAASTAKIMSGLIACEKLKSVYDKNVTITSEMISNVSGKNMGLERGDEIKIKDLMCAAYGCGYNDAATALAIVAAGSVDEMVGLMNKRAKELSMHSTNYTNVTGLDNVKMKTTVRDTVNLAVAASKNELFLEVSSVYNYTFKYADGETRTVYGSNEILNPNSPYYCKSAQGMNSGATDNGGACVVTFGCHNGKSLVAVAMGCEESDERFAFIQDSLDWGYKRSFSLLLKKNAFVGSVPVAMTQIDGGTADAVLAEDLNVIIKPGESEEDIKYTLIIRSDNLTAPIKKGDHIGKYVAWYGDEIRGIADVTVTADVEKSSFLVFVNGIKNYLVGRAFISAVIIIAVVALIALIYPKVSLFRRQRKRRYVRTRGGFNIKKKYK